MILLCEEKTWTSIILIQEMIQKNQTLSEYEYVLEMHSSIYFTHAPLFMYAEV